MSACRQKVALLCERLPPPTAPALPAVRVERVRKDVCNYERDSSIMVTGVSVCVCGWCVYLCMCVCV